MKTRPALNWFQEGMTGHFSETQVQEKVKRKSTKSVTASKHASPLQNILFFRNFALKFHLEYKNNF